MSPVLSKLADLTSALELLTLALENAGLANDPLAELALRAALLHLQDAVRLENERICAVYAQGKIDLFTFKNLN